MKDKERIYIYIAAVLIAVLVGKLKLVAFESSLASSASFGKTRE